MTLIVELLLYFVIEGGFYSDSLVCLYYSITPSERRLGKRFVYSVFYGDVSQLMSKILGNLFHELVSYHQHRV